MTYNVAVKTESLYIHWPFCPYKCHFCPFVAFAGQDHLMGLYTEALQKELENFARACPVKQQIKTVYIGGGTPSTWSNELLLDTSGILKKIFDMSKVSEMTLEVNPGTVKSDQIAVWKEAGINRISMGVQSLDDAVLENLNRHQKKDDVKRLLGLLAGNFRSISIDLIIGLPGVSIESWKATVQEVVRWDIQHISMYFLSIHENTPLYFRLKDNSITLPADDPLVDLYYWTIREFEINGFLQYEVSSFAKKGYESLHNQVYWTREPYKAFGVGASSFDGATRFINDKNLMTYLDKIKNGVDTTVTTELLDNETICLELVMLGLRRKKGLQLNELFTYMNDDRREKFLENMKEMEANHLLYEKNGVVYLETLSYAIENEIALRLLQ